MDITKGYHLHIRGDIAHSFVLIVQDVPEATIEMKEGKVRLELHKPRRELCMAQIGMPRAMRAFLGVEDEDQSGDDSFVVVEEYCQTLEEVGKTLRGFLTLQTASSSDDLTALARLAGPFSYF